MKTTVAIIGAGPAGLTAGYLLSKNEVEVTVLEADPVYVGGISRTATYKGFHFDIGGHRFFSKSKAVEDLWTEILPNDMLQRPRSSRIFYGGKFFAYPLKPFEALIKLGIVQSTLCILSWLKARLLPVPDPRNFEDWVTNQFGRRLFNIFFKSYTEKVWGMSCREISADWAAQRIKGLSLGSAIKNALSQQVSERALRAAESLKYRDFLTVMIILKERNMFDDNWIYIHDPSVKVGRIQNFRSWSPEMVPDPDKACYGLEYFCFEHDGLWDSKDEDLIELGKRELIKIGLAKEGDVLDGCVVRQKKAYPVYDDDYARHVDTIREELEERFPTLHLVGRNGMHKYNNQDHAMMTAMLCVENILAEEKIYDLWQVNGDAEYHEAGSAPAEETHGTAIRLVPMRVEPAPSATLASE